jgi:threonine/homoserine/homoserine lactone efflux protein
MTSAATVALFALAALITVATPGPTVLLALSNGSRHGLSGAAPGIAGALLSDLLLIAAAAFGLGSLLAASETAFSVMKVLGACYLAWLGLCVVKQPATSVTVGEKETGRETAARSFQRSLLVALSNPKGLLFFSALLPQFIEPAAPQAAQYATLGLIFVLIDGAALVAYAMLGVRWVSGVGSRGATIVNRSCGAALMALAAMLAVAPHRAS